MVSVLKITVITCLAAVLMSGVIAAPATEGQLPAPPPVPFQINTDRTRHAMNWFDGQMEVVGKGFALNGGMVQARATAYTILINQARKAIATLQVDSGITLAPVLKDDPDAKRIADQMVARIVIASEQWDEKTGAYTIVGVMPLYGQHSLTYLGAKAMPSFKPIDLTNDLITITMPIPRGHTPQKFAEPYTGIIVNGDQALLMPCLYPRIMRFDGKEMWGPFTLTPADAIAGPVRYAPNLQAALRDGLGGERPLIITAVGNGLSYNPVVNLDDVYLVMVQQKKNRILNYLPIIVTLGQKELPPSPLQK
ncbi:MAG: hypothetical protein ACYDCO_20500 [Armatimonadota bacterium]